MNTDTVASVRWLRWILLIGTASVTGFLLSLTVSAMAQHFNVAATTRTSNPTVTPANPRASRILLVIHGGAGTIRRADLTPQEEADYRAALTQSLQAGHAVLRAGGTSLTAVIAAIKVMEDSPLFNAGRGAVFTRAGTNELDAAVMDGHTLRAGAVAGVKHIANPIELARLVMDRSPHVLLIAEGAEAFAKEQGVALVSQKYFFTQRRWDEYLKAKAAREPKPPGASADLDPRRESKYGTVGAVALDAQGNLAAGTSTGGLTYKLPGRVGDSPIIGAGTYANNASCAVSATGQGEYFIRNVVAHDICSRVAYGHLSLAQAAEDVIAKELVAQGGDGGIIAIDTAGHYTMRFNSEGMYRGVIDAEGKVSVAIFRDDMSR